MLSIDLLDKTTILEYPDILMSVYNHNIKVYIHVIFFIVLKNSMSHFLLQLCTFKDFYLLSVLSLNSLYNPHSDSSQMMYQNA